MRRIFALQKARRLDYSLLSYSSRRGSVLSCQYLFALNTLDSHPESEPQRGSYKTFCTKCFPKWSINQSQRPSITLTIMLFNDASPNERDGKNHQLSSDAWFQLSLMQFSVLSILSIGSTAWNITSYYCKKQIEWLALFPSFTGELIVSRTRLLPSYKLAGSL